jgi:peptidoglycan/xylan/chitin deacetylase (PgdA/CDA1 family)
MKTLVVALAALGLLSCAAQARDCGPNVLGTARTLTIKTGDRQGIGHGYPALGLAKGEIILTFDDGPSPKTTPQILDTLAKDCIQATFFMIGKHAEANPELAKREREEGHSIGSHTYSHRELNKLAPEDATQDIERGMQAVDKAAFGSTDDRPHLFRFPGFKSTPELVSFVNSHRGLVVDRNFGANDWRGDPADVEFARFKERLAHMDRGIVILHDVQSETVKLLPMVIAELKARHMKIVHLVAE